VGLPLLKRFGIRDDVSEVSLIEKLLRGAAKAAGCLMLLAVVGFCGMVNFASAPKKAERDRQARADALVLITVLETYRSEEGRYPAVLEDLIPRFVVEVPGHSDGEIFRYEHFPELHGFKLGYFEAPIGTLPSDGFHSYESTSENWRFDVL
jgi:type II secretory pathway pseudopilin PulG